MYEEAGFKGGWRERDLKREENRKRMTNRITNRVIRKSHWILLAFFTALVGATVALAQNSTLRGRILDERGDAIPGADVTLIGQDGKERKTKRRPGRFFDLEHLSRNLHA